MRHQDLVDFAWRDLLAAAIQDLLGAAREVELAVAQEAPVAREEPDRTHHHRLARPRLPRQRGHAGLEQEREPIDDAEVGDRQVLVPEHAVEPAVGGRGARRRPRPVPHDRTALGDTPRLLTPLPVPGTRHFSSC